MPDEKVSALALIDAVLPTDLIMVIDDPTGLPISKKATASQVLAVAASGRFQVGELTGTPLTISSSAAVTFRQTDVQDLYYMDLAFYPAVDNVRPLGKSDHRWSDAYFAGTVVAGGLGTTPLDATSLTSGALPDARLSVNVLTCAGGYPGGTATFLRADGTFAAPPGGSLPADVVVTSSLAIGTNPATTGVIRLPNVAFVNARNAANTADVNLISLDNGNSVQIGGSSSGAAVKLSYATGTGVWIYNGATMKLQIGDAGLTPQTNNAMALGSSGLKFSMGFFAQYVQIGSPSAGSGYLRIPAAGAITARNSGDTGDISLISTNSDNVWIASGGVADIRWGKALVALGGGAAPTVGTIGGTGPTTAAQNSWLRMLDSTGAACWLPVWK